MDANYQVEDILYNRIKQCTICSTFTTIALFNDEDSQIDNEQKPIINIPRSPKSKFMQDITNKNKQKQPKRVKIQSKILLYLNAKSQQLKQSQQLPKYKQIEKNGNIIQGFCLRDKLEGEGCINLKNGDQFKGIFKNGIPLSGKYTFSNGDKYKGQFSGSYMHGKGVLKIKSLNMKIEGTWNKNRAEGLVKVNYNNGDVYFGNYVNMKKQGRGQYFFNDGRKYIGNFINGQIQGKGILFDKQGNVQAKGQWSNGQLCDLSLTSITKISKI